MRVGTRAFGTVEIVRDIDLVAVEFNVAEAVWSVVLVEVEPFELLWRRVGV